MFKKNNFTERHRRSVDDPADEEVLSDEIEEEQQINMDYEDDRYNMFYGSNFMPDYEQFFARVQPNPEVLKRTSTTQIPEGSLQLNVLMFALDSMSHLSYQRKLPNTYAYLKEQLDAVILNGYNIVGDATTAAMLPILTGNECEVKFQSSMTILSCLMETYM